MSRRHPILDVDRAATRIAPGNRHMNLESLQIEPGKKLVPRASPLPSDGTTSDGLIATCPHTPGADNMSIIFSWKTTRETSIRDTPFNVSGGFCTTVWWKAIMKTYHSDSERAASETQKLLILG